MVDRRKYLTSISKEDRKLVKLFTEEMNRINLLYMRAIHSRDISKANELMKKIKSIAKYLNEEYGERADVRIPQEYIKGSSYISEVLGLSIKGKDIKGVMKELGPIHIQAVNALLDNSKNYVKSSLDGMERQALTMLNELQQEKVREELAKGMISGQGLSNMKERVIEYFSENKITGFKDRSGRLWSMDRYVDMLTRTETNIANVQGTINRAMEMGITKFKIIEQADCCELCSEYNGEIVDISNGAVELPPFHPNCRGYIEAVLDNTDRYIEQGRIKRELQEMYS